MRVRPPAHADLAAVLGVLRAADTAVAGDSDWTASELATEWAELDLDRDAWVLELDGAIAGYASFHARGNRLRGDGYVHPAFHKRGVGSEILRLTAVRGREEEQRIPAGERVYIQNATLTLDACTTRVYRERGYKAVRGFRGMVIELDEPPEVPVIPGIEVGRYVHPEQARAFHAASQESFASHWEHRPMPWEEWEERRFARETFDPTFWWGAFDGDHVAGVVLAEEKQKPDQGWVDVLGGHATVYEKELRPA